MKGSQTVKSKIHRTSSTRKARRKNEFTGEFKRQSLHDSAVEPKFQWSKKFVKLWVGVHLRRMTTILIATGFALWYFFYASALFENSTRFSHLTNVERELTLPTDVAFRYSFFKKIATAEEYLDGLRLVTRDHQNEQSPRTASSFHRHSLSTEAVLAGAYHSLKKFKSWTGWPKTHCKVVSPQGFISSRPTFTHRQSRNVTGERDRDEEDEFFTLSCSGIADPLHFYLAAGRALECTAMILIFFMGLAFGKSILGGIFAVAIFVFLHPQRSNYEWLFPIPEKIGWILVVIQTYTVFRTVFCKVHPPWISAAKIGVSSAVLILGWNTDAQWFLASQLIITAVLHFCGGLSRYVASLVILGQLTGWQYASLVSLDPSLHHWSFFMYTLVASLVTVILIEPIVDWILGKKRDKWKFLRGSILLITFQTILVSVRCDLGQLFTFLEDSRFPLTIGDPYEGMKPWKSVLQVQDITGETLLPTFDMNNFQTSGMKESLNVETHKNSIESEKEPHLGIDIKRTNEENSTESDGMLSLQLTEFLRSCFLCQAKSYPVKFLSKYFFLIFATLYTLLVAVLFPLCVPAQRDSGSEAVQGKEELWEFGKATKIKNAWNPFYGSLLLFGESSEDEPCSCSSGEDDDDKTQPLHGRKKRRGNRMKNGNLWRWDSYLSYHIAQTIFFGVFCLWLDKRWEIFFVPHVSLVLSLLCDFRRVSKVLKSSPFSYAFHVHWGTVILIVAVLVASARLRSNAMYQKSRGRFEIGNARVGGLMETVKWIRENTESSARLAGADNIMVALELSAERISVSHHLTVHSWANQKERKGKEREQGLHDKLERSESPKTNTRQAQVPIRSRATTELQQDEVDLEDEDDEREDLERENSRSGLISKLAAGNLDKGQAEKEASTQVTMTSLLTSQEMQHLASVYTIYSRNKSIKDFHSGLISLNVSYFVLSQQMCPELSSTASPTMSSSNVLNTISQTNLVTNIGSNSRTGSNNVPRGTTALPPKVGSAQIFFRPEEDQQEIEQRNFSISGIWQWHWNWQEPIENQESQLSSLQFPKRCDFVNFWDDVERRNERPEGAGRDQSQYSNAKGQPDAKANLKFKFRSGSPGFNKAGRSKDAGDDRNGKESDFSVFTEDTLCYRLVNERNVLPFKRAFQNTFFTILAV